jgi:hypothetical protein
MGHLPRTGDSEDRTADGIQLQRIRYVVLPPGIQCVPITQDRAEIREANQTTLVPEGESGFDGSHSTMELELSFREINDRLHVEAPFDSFIIARYNRMSTFCEEALMIS